MNHSRNISLVIICVGAILSLNAITRPDTDREYDFLESHNDRTSLISDHHHDRSYGQACASPDVVLPDYHIPSVNEQRYSVIGFYGGVFNGCSNIRTVTIPRTYTTIPATTFIDCQNLVKFLPENLSSSFDINDGILYVSATATGSSKGVLYCYPAGRADAEFQIPAMCRGIGDYAFYRNHHLSRVITHDKIFSLGQFAFAGCDNLISITIPGTIKTIGRGAFSDCVNLKTLTIEDGVKVIDANAFQNCSSLETVIIPASVTQINEHAFDGCSNLKTVILQSGIRTFGADVFSECASLAEVRIVDLSGWCQSEFETPLANPAYLSQRINYIGEMVTDLVIPSTALKIGKNAFYGYTPLRSVAFHDNVSSVSKDAFAHCSNLEVIKIPDMASWCNVDFASEMSNPLTYARKMVLNDVEISVLEIPEGVSRIKQYAFNNGAFSQIWLPTSVNEISDAAFGGITPNSVRCYNTTPPAIVNTAFSDYSAVLFVPDESQVSYWSHTVWGLFGNIKDMPIDAAAITFDKTECELNVHDVVSLSVTFTPAETTDKNIFWNSSDESVATVKDGVVTALKKGNAIITATTINNRSATCRLTVKEVLADAITIYPDELTLTQGAAKKLSVRILPENATNQSVTWSSEDESVAAIDEDGVVTALSEGTTRIIAITQDDSGLTASCRVVVEPVEPTSVTLSEGNRDLVIGESFIIIADVQPEGAKNKNVVWHSSAPEIVSVTNDGVVTGRSEGQANITATTCNGLSASCLVSVYAPDILVSSILFDQYSAEGREGEQVWINATVLPDDATNKDLSWSSSDESIATVDDYGVISLLKTGSAKITATAADGSGVSAICSVTVYDKYISVSSIVLNPTSVEGEEGVQIPIEATVLPEDASDKILLWGSSDESVATVDESGLVSLLKKGSAVITASATDGSGVSADCAVVVTEYSGIDDILTDWNTYVRVFNLQGVLVYEGLYAEANLEPGYYIVVCDGKKAKLKLE